MLRRLACPVVATTVLRGEDGILMVGDSGAELHVVGKNDRGYVINERKRDPLCVSDTANGKIVLDVEGDVVCDGILLKNCVYNPYASFSLLSISCLEHDGWTYLQGGGQCTLKNRATTKTLVRSGGLYLLGAAGRWLAAVEATTEIVITANDEVLL